MPPPRPRYRRRWPFRLWEPAAREGLVGVRSAGWTVVPGNVATMTAFFRRIRRFRPTPTVEHIKIAAPKRPLDTLVGEYGARINVLAFGSLSWGVEQSKAT